jgi:hypothetical protein
MTREEFIANNSLESVCSSLNIQLRGSSDERTAKCPFHEDRVASLSVNVHKRVWKCFAGCGGGSVIDLIMKAEHLSFGQFAEKYDISKNGYHRNGHTNGHTVKSAFEPQPTAEIDKEYSYRDLMEREVFQVVRFKPKTFRQRHREGDRWVWNLSGVQRVLYRLPQIAKSQIVWHCFSEDTEVLTPTGWKLLRDINLKDKVAQYRGMDKAITFVEPDSLQSFMFFGEMVLFDGKSANAMVTPDHRMLIRKPGRSGFGSPTKLEALECQSHWQLPVSGFCDSTGEHPTADEARLLASIQADGHYPKGFQLQWNLKKPRKKERLRLLLKKLSLQWVESEYQSTPDWTLFAIPDRRKLGFLMEFLPNKHFDWSCLKWPQSVRESLILELGYWDGDCVGKRGIRFFTSNRSDAEIMNALSVVSGFSSCVRLHDRRETRPNTQVEYVVSITKSTWRSIEHIRRVDYGGIVYCLTVPNHNIVTRRDGKCLITGQCEGEKDADNLVALGYEASTSCGGVNSWLDAYAETYQGKDVIICGDTDKPGQEYVDRVFDSLAGKAATVRIVDLPKTVKDVSEYIAGFKSIDEAKKALDDLCLSAHPFIKGYKVVVSGVEDYERSYKQHLSTADGHVLDLGKWLPSFKALRPLVPGEFAVFIGDTGTGKTAVLSSLAMSSSAPSILFELELPQELMFERLLAAKHRMTCREVEIAYRNGQDIGKEALRKLFSNLYVCVESGLTLDAIASQISRAELKMGVRPSVVYLDYLQLIRGASHDRYERMSDIAEGIKLMAKQLRVVVVAASQIHRPKDGSKINLHSAKDSGAIENSSGLVIRVDRGDDLDNPDPGYLGLKVLKSTKDGGGKYVVCNFDGAKMLITERAHEQH